jgi:hypothetical protein
MAQVTTSGGSPTGTVGTGYGAGATGAVVANVASNRAGAAGTGGIIIVWEFL